MIRPIVLDPYTPQTTSSGSNLLAFAHIVTVYVYPSGWDQSEESIQQYSFGFSVRAEDYLNGIMEWA